MRSKPILGSDSEENKTSPPPSPEAPVCAQPASPSPMGAAGAVLPCLSHPRLLSISFPPLQQPHHRFSFNLSPNIPSRRLDRSGNSPFFILTRTRKHLKPSNRDHYSVIIIKNGTLQDPRSPPFSP